LRINTDREIWREFDSYYADSIHVTEANGIGINCGGHVIVAPAKKWHRLGELFLCVNPNEKLALKFIRWLLWRSGYGL